MAPSAPIGGSASTAGAGEIFQILRDGTARTRSELAQITGLARSTIVPRVDLLLQAGLIVPAGEAASAGGRPPSRFAFNPQARTIIAIDLGATHGMVGIADLAGNILLHESRELDIAEGPETVIGWALTTSQKLMKNTERSLDEVIGIGVGVPGPVEHATGKPTHPPIMPGWDRFDVPDFIQKVFNVPVYVDNDVNLLALGEQATVWPNVSDLLFVKVSTGIGAGIISGGQLQRGAQGTAGDMGHVRVPYTADSLHDPHDERDLEAIASGPAIASALRAQGIPAETNQHVVDLIRQGNVAATQATRQAGRSIGEVLAMCVNMLNPSVIVVGGSVARASEQLIAGIREVIYRRSIPLATQHLAIVQARGGETAGARGAAIMVAQQTLSVEFVDAMLTSAQKVGSER